MGADVFRRNIGVNKSEDGKAEEEAEDEGGKDEHEAVARLLTVPAEDEEVLEVLTEPQNATASGQNIEQT